MFSNAYRFSKILNDAIGTSGGHAVSQSKYRQRLAPTRAAVSPVEGFERDNAERNTIFIAHTSPVHQDPLENWRDGTASALGHVPELGRTPE